MLVRKCELLDLQEVCIPEQAIEIDTQPMRRQLRIQPRTQPAKAMSMVVFDVELLRQLAVHRFHDLASRFTACRTAGGTCSTWFRRGSASRCTRLVARNSACTA